MNVESRGLWETEYGSTANTSNDLSKVLIGALAGAALGSLIGGAFTQKGIEIRSRASTGSKNIVNNVKNKVSNMAGTIADKYEATKENAADLIEKGKQKVGMSSENDAYTTNAIYTGTAEADETGPGSKILLGVLIVSVASTIVLSFATEKGNETRKRVAKGSKNIANNLKDKVTNVAGDIAKGVSNTYQAAKEGAVDLLEKEKQKNNYHQEVLL